MLRKPPTKPVNKQELNIASKIAIANAKIKLAELERRSREIKEVDDPYLYSAIYSCIEAEKKLPEELSKIDDEIESIKVSAPSDPKTPIRVKYMEWTKQNLTWNVERASKVAKERLEHLENLNTPSKRKAELERCRADSLYWFKWYAWTVDPRSNLLWAVPFILFEYQEEYIEWVESLIFKRRTDGLIDKSRDMGITWTTIDLFAKHWLMPSNGTSFQALVGSIKATDVDELGNPSTILEKLRLQFRLTPKWMMPKGFDPKFPLMKCINPENGSAITGETANEDFARSGRYTVVWFDEYARFELAEPAYTASSQSTNTRLFTFTPYGKNNYASYLRFNGSMPIKSYHWTRHPFKTVDWYNGEALKLSKAQIGQELDIDYDTSQEGRVYETYNEIYHIVTKSEFMTAFPNSRDSRGNFTVPKGCHIAMGEDWGSTLEHKNMMLWFFVLREGSVTTKGIDLSGSVFMFHEHKQEPSSTVRMCANYIREFENSVGVEQNMVTDRLMSHEAKSERDTYSIEHNLHFTAWNTDLNAGIAQVKDYLEIHSFHQPHPFREYTREEHFSDKKPIMGRPRFFIIVDDEQGSLNYDETLNRWYVNVPVDDGGAKETRTEFPMYHFPKEETGKPTKRLKPVKMKDDAMDVVRCVASTFFPPIGQLTATEKIERAMPDYLKTHNILKESPEEMARSWIARREIENKIKKNQKLKSISWRDGLYEKSRIS